MKVVTVSNHNGGGGGDWDELSISIDAWEGSLAQNRPSKEGSDPSPSSAAVEPRREVVIRHYTHFPNRFNLRATYAILVFASVILGTAVVYGLDVHVRRMEFTTIYALHTAMAYTFSFILCDMVVVRFWPGWGSYEARTVKKLWRIL